MPYRPFLSLALTGLFAGALAADAGRGRYFEPSSRLSGIGVGRAELSADIITHRTAGMIESQTFAILRDPRAVAGAQRILSPKLQLLFNKAASASGVPSSLIAAIAYLESFGDPRAQSPSGPRGMMQISAGTARAMGLTIRYAKRYRTQTRTRRVKTRQGKWITRRVRVRVPYTVLVRDDRMIPERAVPAAAKYVARLAGKFGGLDWAVFAYHCGEGCAATMRGLTEKAEGIQPPYTVAKMFFAATPAVNRELYLAIEHHMKRDDSPTYWFRVMRARELLALYRKDSRGFRELAGGFRYAVAPQQRAPHRLAVWLGSEEPFGSCDGSPVSGLDDSGYYGFRLRTTKASHEQCLLASPSAIGTLAYIAFETRRLHEAMDVTGERFVPLEITPLAESSRVPAGPDNWHSTGHVLHVNYGELPPGQREAFEFVLNDLGWGGYLGFIRTAANSQALHIGCSPPSRDFFDGVFADALQKIEQATDSTSIAEPVSNRRSP